MFAYTLLFISTILRHHLPRKEGTHSHPKKCLLFLFFLLPFLHFRPDFRPMEQQDWNMIAADCLVLSCCCQCLLLQLLVFVLLKLPTKLIKKTKEYVKRKFGNGGKMARMKVARCAEEVVGCKKPRVLMRVRARESFRLDECMEDVEEVLEELCTKGEFGFGSFWRGDDGNNIDVHFPICLVNQEVGASL